MRFVATPSPVVCIALLATILPGCTVGPNFHAPEAPASTRFTEAPLPDRTASAATPGGSAQQLTPDRDIPGEWWDLFHSSQITALVTQALKANPDVAAAQATLRQARETMRAEQGALMPQVSASAEAQRARESFASFGFSNGSSNPSHHGPRGSVSRGGATVNGPEPW